MRIGDGELWLLKPMAYMNRSGGVTAAVAGFYKIPTQSVLVAHDELDLPIGTARLKEGGGAGGHNGLKDLIATLGADNEPIDLNAPAPVAIMMVGLQGSGKTTTTGKIAKRLTDRMARACAQKKAQVTSIMTGPYGRLNHFAHPDAEVRQYYVDWFKGMADIAGDLGTPAIGTQFGISNNVANNTYNYGGGMNRQSQLHIAVA